MPNEQRGIIKWRPFDSVISGNKVVKELLKERSKIKKPILSEEQENILEQKLVIAFYTNSSIKVSYFNNGTITGFEDQIKKIDSIYHKIYFYHHTLLFEQIIEIL